jgi:hypothetical protein
LKRWEEHDTRRLGRDPVRRGGQNIPNQAAPAQTITFLAREDAIARTEDECASNATLCGIPTSVLLHVVLPQLDFTSLMTLLCSCKFFRDLEDIGMLSQHRGARLFIIDTALQQINFLNACKVDLEMILDPEKIKIWMQANDGSEVLDFNYFDVYKPNFGELGDEVQDDSPQHGGVGGDGGPTPGEASMPAAPASTAAAPAVAAHGASGSGGGASFSTGATTGTSLSLWEYLGREPPDPADSDEKLEWFRDEVNSSLNQIRDEVLDSFRDRLDLPVDYLRIQTEQVCAALIRKRYASLTCPQTTGSRFSVLDQLHYEVAQRLAAAEDLHSRLQDSNETLLFHSSIASCVNSTQVNWSVSRNGSGHIEMARWKKSHLQSPRGSTRGMRGQSTR